MAATVSLPPSTPPTPPATARERALAPTLVLVALVVAVLSSVGAPLIPSIAAASNVSLSTAEWLLTLTLLTGALATPIMGRLADGPRQRRVITVCMSVVLVGCVLAATVSTFGVLVLARGLQGLGLGILPVTMAIARRTLPPDRAARTIAVLSVTAGVGVGLGYPVTGLLAQVSDYHAAFWFSAGVVAVALLLSTVVLPAESAATARPFDTWGAGLLSVALAGLILALSEGESWGWASPSVLVPLAAAIALLAVWVGYELQRRDPLVELRQARNRMVLTADISGFIISVTMYLYLPIVVEFVQVPSGVGYGFGASVVVAGCVLIPLSAVTLLASRLAPSFERWFGRRLMIPIGAVLFAVAMGFFALEHRVLWEAFFSMAIAGLGIGFTFAAMPGFIIAAVDARDTGSAMGFYQVLRSVGLALGSALSGVMLAAYASGAQDYPRVGGFTTTLFLGAGLCLFTAALSYLLPGRGAGPVPVDRAGAQLMEEEAELGGSGIMLTGTEVE